MNKSKVSLSGFLKYLYLFLIFIFLYLPIIILVVYSFNKARFMGVWKGFTIKWYLELFEDSEILSSLYNTVIIASVSSFFSVFIGTFGAIGINDLSYQKKNFLLNTSYIAMINPDIVIGVSLISLFSILKFLKLGYATIIIAHITLTLPFAFFTIIPKVKSMDKNLYEAAYDLGANHFEILFMIILPEIKDAIISAFLLCFTLSLDDFIISFFTAGSGINTLPIQIYSMTKRGVSPKINALTTLMLAFIIIMMSIIRKRKKIK